MEEHDKRFWRNMTFAQLRNRRVRVSAYGGDMILEFQLAPGAGHTLGARQYTVNGFERIELYAALNNQRTRKALGITVESSPRKQNRQRINTQ